MRIFNFYLCLMCFLLAAGVVNSQTLNKVYSGEKLPTEEGWQELKLDGTINPLAGTVSQEATNGSLKLKSTNDGDKFTQLGWYKTGLDLNLSSGYTIEIKAKVIEASKYGAFNIQGYDNEGRGFRIGIYDAYLAEQTNPLSATNILKSNLNNADGFHTYRITIKSTGGTLYRDTELIGSFPLSAFYFDNIIENGGFEDGDDPNDMSFFPDFSTNASMYRTDNTEYLTTGKWGLIMDNQNMVGPFADMERARTREFAVKPEADYNISITRRRIAEEPWAWRDMGAFWDTQDGTQNGEDHRDPNVMFASANEPDWLVHNQKIKSPADVKSLRFEFPSWERDEVKTLATTAFDDFYFSEDYGLTSGPQVEVQKIQLDPVFPDNFTNLIENGDFENHELNNDGSEYFWALSNEDNSNEPVDYNPLWGGDVRIQKNDKPDDQLGEKWAHSGTSSLRFSTLGGNSNDFNFTKELEPNKTYRFNFWMRNPHWNDYGWVRVKIGSEIIWGHQLGGRNNVWSNVDLIFTTTAENTTLSLYSEDHGDWFNIYFDDFVLYEKTTSEPDPTLGKTNLFANGDFEDPTLGNDGEEYTWALASGSGDPDHDNYPVSWSDLWGTYVRLQDCKKSPSGDQDTGENWAHSGNKSMRFSRLNNNEKTNMNFRKELEPNKTYTLDFWYKTANYPDRGKFFIANEDIVLWGGEFGTECINWTRQSVTFSTNNTSHALRMYTELTGWFNFYLDDIFLYEEDSYIPLVADSYLFFGKSTGTHPANVEIEYVAVDNTGAYAPSDVNIEKVTKEKNLKANSSNGILTFNVQAPTSIAIYDVAGTLISQFELQSTKSLKLTKGVYIVRSTSQGAIETLKVINK